jgi:hypothetical protein
VAKWRLLTEDPEMITEGGDTDEMLSNQDPEGGDDDSNNNP